MNSSMEKQSIKGKVNWSLISENDQKQLNYTPIFTIPSVTCSVEKGKLERTVKRCKDKNERFKET